MKRLDQHENAHSFSFKQGPLGQVSPKLTCFLAVNLSKCSEYVRSFSSAHFRPMLTAVRTVEEDGCFSTAKLKTYPPRLNAVIVSSFID